MIVMVKEGASILKIFGRVEPDLVASITKRDIASKSNCWFFVDYASNEILLNTKFDVVLEGEAKKLITGPGFGPNQFLIELVECIDQFGNNLNAIPKGYKTICRFDFKPAMPEAFSKLPVMKGWNYNPGSLSIGNHNDLEYDTFDLLIVDLYRIIIVQLKDEFKRKHYTRFRSDDFLNVLTSSYHISNDNAHKILEQLKQLGKISTKNGEELELVEIDE